VLARTISDLAVSYRRNLLGHNKLSACSRRPTPFPLKEELPLLKKHTSLGEIKKDPGHGSRRNSKPRNTVLATAFNNLINHGITSKNTVIVIYDNIHVSPPLNPILSSLNLVRSREYYLFEIYLTTNLQSIRKSFNMLYFTVSQLNFFKHSSSLEAQTELCAVA
jgi:hypothetical protein